MVLSLLAVTQVAAMLAASPCSALEQLTLENAAVQSAVPVAAGVFNAPGRPNAAATGSPLPAHCRVSMLLTPSSDSRINVELWLPESGWNGKFLAVGNGGWAGSIQGYGDMQEALRRGYATAGTDTGHSADDGPAGMFALGHPEKIVDFAYRAVHDMTVKSKQVIRAFYDSPLHYSYFKGCSTGGRQAVMAAQRYPGDFDGIIAGALANRHIHMHTVGANRGIEIARDPQMALSADKAAFVNESVMAQCDTLREGFLNNPRQCHFDFDALACGRSDSSGMCLSPGELASVRTFYDGVYNAKGELIFSGQALGNPIPPLAAQEGQPNPFAFDTIRILGFQDADYDWQAFDIETDLPLIDAAVGWVDAVDPDLRAFKAHGGKLLLYAGWRDTGITPENTIYYFESVQQELGGDESDWMRLFMAPGMGHCRGGPGVDTFDTLATLESWRERGEAPQSIPASNRETGLERPLCPFPQAAPYTGSGALDDADSWECEAP